MPRPAQGRSIPPLAVVPANEDFRSLCARRCPDKTLDEVAEGAGVSRRTFGYYLSGAIADPNTPTVRAIAAFIGDTEDVVRRALRETRRRATRRSAKPSSPRPKPKRK